MVIAEKAAGRIARHIVSGSICVTLFGFACVVIVLCGSFFQNIFESFNVNLTTCDWMIIITAALTPLCLLGTPKVRSNLSYLLMLYSHFYNKGFENDRTSCLDWVMDSFILF